MSKDHGRHLARSRHLIFGSRRRLILLEE